MNKILPIILVVLFSSNVFADLNIKDNEVSVEDRISQDNYTEIYLNSGDKGYLLVCNKLTGCYTLAGELCKKEGYSSYHLQEYPAAHRWIIFCN